GRRGGKGPSPTWAAGLVGGGTARGREGCSAAVPVDGGRVVAVAVAFVGVADRLVAGRAAVARQQALGAGALAGHRGRRERGAAGLAGRGRGGADHGRVEAGGAGVHQRVVLRGHLAVAAA